MRALVAIAVLLVSGLVGFVVLHERGKAPWPQISTSDENVEVATISTGERVDITAHVPSQGLTIVEFTADF